MTLTRLALLLPLAVAIGCGARSQPKATEPAPDLDFPVGPFSLTAPTKDLQQFYLKHLSTEGAYGEGMELTRQKKP